MGGRMKVGEGKVWTQFCRTQYLGEYILSAHLAAARSAEPRRKAELFFSHLAPLSLTLDWVSPLIELMPV